MLLTNLSTDWRGFFDEEASKSYFLALRKFVARERQIARVYPPASLVFEAFRLCSYAMTQVVILGQDPYHAPGQAHGLSFSVPFGMPLPPSLRNILRELQNDLGIPTAAHGCLKAWARQGVLLLNSVLTVREGEPGSHRNRGWEQLTDRVVSYLNERREPVIFVLWGRWARQKKGLIHAPRHEILESAHPSPLSAQGFFGSRPFSRINTTLIGWGRKPVDWRLPPPNALGATTSEPTGERESAECSAKFGE